MTTPLIWKSLKLYNTMFSPLCLTPVSWDEEKHEFRFLKRLHKLKPWLFVNIVLIFGLTTIPIVYVLLKQLFSPNLSTTITERVVLFLILACALFGNTFNLGVYKFGEDAVIGANSFQQLETEVLREIRWKSQMPKYNLLGIGCTASVIVFAMYAYAVPILAVFSELDPQIHLFRMLLSPEVLSLTWVKIPLLLVRCAILVPVGAEIFRMFPLCLICCIIVQQIILKSLKLLSKKSYQCIVPTRFASHVNLYIKLQYAVKYVSQIQSTGTTSLMAIGLSLNVIFNLCTLKLYSVIPIPLNLFPPTVSIAIPLIVNAILPPAINTYEHSLPLLRTWKLLAGSISSKVSTKFHRRRISSIKPLQFFASVNGFNLFLLKKSTKITYYSNIVNYTIDGLLTM